MGPYLGVDLSWLYPVFVTAAVPSSFIDDFLATNAKNFPPISTGVSPYVFELIRSRSSIVEQTAALESDLPDISGTKPPISSHSLESAFSATAIDEGDSFVGASLDELAAFVKCQIPPAFDILRSRFFVVIDGDSPIDKSVTLVEMLRDKDCVEDEDEYVDVMSALPEQVKTMALRREKLMKRSSSDDRAKINTLRVGMAFCGLLEAFEFTSCCMDTLKMGDSLDGIYWGEGFRAKNPPPMNERMLGEEERKRERAANRTC